MPRGKHLRGVSRNEQRQYEYTKGEGATLGALRRTRQGSRREDVMKEHKQKDTPKGTNTALERSREHADL